MAGPEADHAALDCPRCGYDLRGAVAGWHDSCPLDGRCGECGLSFAWGALISQTAHQPRWCIEFARRRHLVVAAAATLIMVFVPWKLWSSIRLAHAVRGRRLLLYVGFVLTICYVMFALGHGLMVHRYWSACFGTNVTSSTSAGQAMIRSALLPFATEPLGQRTDAGGTRPWYSPWDLRTFWSEAWPVLVYGLIVTAISACVLFVIAALPRHKAMRTAHIGRVAVYSAGLCVGFWGLGLAWSVAYWVNIWSNSLVIALWVLIDDQVMIAGVPLFMLAWWRAAIHRYLRLGHGWVIAATITLTACGGALVATWFIDQGFVQGVFHSLMWLVQR